MSLLTVCQDVAESTGITAPSTIVNNSDKTAKQLLKLAIMEGESLSKARNWSELVSEDTITLVTGDQDYALADDFRWIVPSTTYDRSGSRIVLNPITSQYWQYLKAWTSINGLTYRARIRAGQLEFQQTIGAADNGKTIAYEYLSNYWAETSGGTAKRRFTLDSDVIRLDEDLFKLGLIWRFRRAKGLDYETELSEYNGELSKIKANDGGARILNMAGGSVSHLDTPNVPDSGYG